MRILLAIDGSSYSDLATRTLEALQLPSETEILVLTVVPEFTFLGGITLDMIIGNAKAKKKTQLEKVSKLLEDPVQLLSASGFKVESMVRWGKPAEEIIGVSDEFGASLIVMGARGLTEFPASRLGSVAQTVMKYAKTSVLLAKKKSTMVDQDSPSEGNTLAMNRVLFATDGSEYSDRVIKFLLDLPLTQQSHVIVLTALQSHSTALLKIPTLDLEINYPFLADLQETEAAEAKKIVTRSSRQFQNRGYKTNSIIMRKDANESILQVIEKSGADIVALGSSGMSGVESFAMGSIAERIAKHAPCSVLIVRPPKE